MPNAKKKIARKVEKRYEFVTFNYDVFEGDFVLPKFPPPIGVLRRVQKGDVAKLIEWLEDAKVEEEYLEAIDSLDAEELEGFINAWTNGQLASAPKS